MTEPYILIDGIKYSAYRPKDCRFCYYWKKRQKRCCKKKCYYLIDPLDPVWAGEKPAPGRCPGCPYGRVRLCVGYCTAKLVGELRKS